MDTLSDRDREAHIASSLTDALNGLASPTPIVEGATVTIGLTPDEVQLIVGPGVPDQTARADKCRAWIAGRLRSFGTGCRSCGQLLIGGERNVCGHCKGVTS